MSLTLVSPFPQTRLDEAWKWHERSAALTARLGREAFLEHFTRLLTCCPSWGLMVDGALRGIWLIEPTDLPGDTAPSDGNIHIALARSAWGRGVIQQAAKQILPVYWRLMPSARRLSAWTAESNYPARAVAESVGFTLEGAMRNALSGGDALLLYGLTRRETDDGIGTN